MHPTLKRAVAILLTIAGAFGVTVQQVLGVISGAPGIAFVILAWAFVLLGISIIAWPKIEGNLPWPKQANEPESENERKLKLVETELSLAHEEAIEMAKLLVKEWPYITPDGALVENAASDWRAKTTQFIEATLPPSCRAAFKGATQGKDQLEALESEAQALGELSACLTPEMIRTDESNVRKAAEVRRKHEAAGFLNYDSIRRA